MFAYEIGEGIVDGAFGCATVSKDFNLVGRRRRSLSPIFLFICPCRFLHLCDERFLPGFAPFVDGTVIVTGGHSQTSPLTLPSSATIARYRITTYPILSSKSK